MLWSEFVEGTGCRDNESNYKLYKELELIYMNSDCSKAHIYEMGKKLADNSKSEDELKVEAEIKAEIAEHKAQIDELKGWIKDNEQMAKYWQGDKEMIAFYRNSIKRWKEEIKEHRNKISALQWILG